MWKDENLSDELLHCTQSWKDKNPDWSYMFWTDDMLDTFIFENYNWFHEKYCSYEHNIMRSDTSRLFLIYHYGGLYVDVDIECIKPIDSLIDNECIFFYEYPDIKLQQSLYCEKIITSSVIYCEKNNPDIYNLLRKLLLPEIQTNDPNIYILSNAGGPIFLTKSIDKNKPKYKLIIKDNKHFENTDIISRHEMLKIRKDYKVDDDTYGIHWNLGSWIVGDSRLKYNSDK